MGVFQRVEISNREPLHVLGFVDFDSWKCPFRVMFLLSAIKKKRIWRDKILFDREHALNATPAEKKNNALFFMGEETVKQISVNIALSPCYAELKKRNENLYPFFRIFERSDFYRSDMPLSALEQRPPFVQASSTQIYLYMAFSLVRRIALIEWIEMAQRCGMYQHETLITLWKPSDAFVISTFDFG